MTAWQIMYRRIETDRLLIRPVTTADKLFILDLLNTPGWLQFIGDRKVNDQADAEKYIQNILDNKNAFYNVFELKETRQLVGIITFLFRDTLAFPDIGFAMLPEFGNKGYAFEAAKRYLDEIANAKHMTKIMAITQSDNLQSIRLIKRLGLTYEDKFIDNSDVLHIYSITLDRYKQNT